jgi:hypothetical protein
MTGGWPVTVAAPRVDPFLAATLWLIERAHWAIIAGPEAYSARSVHAKILMESVIVLDGTHPGPLALHDDLGVVLAAPTPEQLASLHRSHFDPTASWFLIPSSHDSHEREMQEAWVWAQSRPAPGAAPAPRRGAVAASDSLLTPAEAWALALRAGRETPIVRSPRRGRMRLIPGGQ